MNYKELIKQCQDMSEEQQSKEVCIFDSNEGVFCSVKNIEFFADEETRELEQGHPFFNVYF